MMAIYIVDIPHPFPSILPATLGSKYDHCFVMGEELHAQKGRQSLTSSQVVSGEPSACLYAILGPQILSELNHRPQSPIS